MAEDLRRPVEAARVDVVLLALADVLWRGPQPELEALFELLYEDGAVIETIMPPLVKVVFGLPFAGNDRKDRRTTAELALLSWHFSATRCGSSTAGSIAFTAPLARARGLPTAPRSPDSEE